MDPSERRVVWTARHVRDSDLVGDDRFAATSNSVGLPQLLAVALRHLPGRDRCPGPVVDLGSGLGGVGGWCRDRTGRDVVAVDRSSLSCRAAIRLFPDLGVARADVGAVPIRSGVAAMTVLNGVLSLLDEPEPAIREAVRITRPGGVLAIADVVSSRATVLRTSRNRFWSIEHLIDVADALGLEVVDVACCSMDAGEFGEASDAVVRALARRHRTSTAFRAWTDDRRLIADLGARGRVLGAAVVARVPAPA